MKHIFHPLLLIAVFLLACKNQPTPENATAEPKEQQNNLPLSLEDQTHKWSSGDCDVPDGACLKIDIKYPKVINGDPTIREKINEDIRDYIISTFELEESEKVIESIEEAAQLFIASYEEIKNDIPESAGEWAMEVSGQHAIHNNVLVIQLVSYTQFGGVHPNVYLSFTNFDLSTGDEIYIEDIIKDSKAFNRLAEKQFYITRDELDEDDLQDAFWGKGFYLPENFAITAKGIKLFYNSYEVLAYIYGQTEYILPYKDLEGIIELPE